MGIALSCPLADFEDLDSHFDALLVKSIKYGHGNVKTAFRSASFNGRDSKPAIIRFKGRNLNATFSFRSPTTEMQKELLSRPIQAQSEDKSGQSSLEIKNHMQCDESGNRRYQAALRLQKVYKSFRTRRQLADCAVVVEQRWWKLLDFAELKRSSISFFDIERPETAISRWSRARRRAAKVGKGLSKDAKARKLALQHWLEAIDPRHRYGHNLQFYYVNWLHCQSKQPFFYWLDIGEGKETSLDRCPRSKLQQQCIKYLGPTERQAYAVVIKDGKFFFKQSGELLDTKGQKDVKWIFVLSTSKTLYVGVKKKGTFQHSSFLAGGATLSAGRLVVEDGVLKAVWPHSGHYLPTEENFQEFMSFLREQKVDLSDVKKSPAEEEEEEATIKKCNSSSVRDLRLDADLCQDTKVTNVESMSQENTDFRGQDSSAAENDGLQTLKLSCGFRSRIAKLEIPTRDNVREIFNEVAPSTFDVGYQSAQDSFSHDDGYESAEDSFLTEEDFMFPKINLFDEDQEEEDEEPIPKEKILERINSHKGMRSYQLAKQLSSRWTTGAGPRIGCMRDYPTELQFRVLESANLSPRKGTWSANSTPRTGSCSSPKYSTTTSCLIPSDSTTFERTASRFSPKRSTPTSSLSRNDSSTSEQKETMSKSPLGVGREVTNA
ncbi:IQ domain-containing protein IQM6 isoform X2 [Jatropha curcas]|uniref:IQ domain-containing protein IQM6 isoform X2 n=1 Tax=Jatropha curcas TaxID=180498 RepID=UPI0005FB3BC7|nr:IQ domain-containing protein IQM6 isoform X2 [Jatropha curcas]